MELRPKKKVSVKFFLEGEIKHKILPLGEGQGSKTPVGNRRAESRRRTNSDDEGSTDERLTAEWLDGNEHAAAAKSTALITENEASGREMFGFNTPSKRGNLSLKVKESLELQSPRTLGTNGRTPKSTHKTPKTPVASVTPRSRGRHPKTPQIDEATTPLTPRSRGRPPKTPKINETTSPLRTPRSCKPAKVPAIVTPLKTPKSAKPEANGAGAKTPFSLRLRFKEKLSQKALAEELGCSTDSDFSLSDSDDESDDSESDPKANESDGDPDEIIPRKPAAVNRVVVAAPTQRQSARIRSSTNAELKFVVDSDEYFRLGKKRAVTSNHTLSRLKTPRLPPDELRTLLAKTKPSHEKPIKELVDEYRRSFTKWAFTLEQGFNVLVYGVGSKRTLLNMFHQEMLADWPVVVCNGFFPSLTIKEVVDSILQCVLGATSQPRGGLLDSIELIEHALGNDTRKNGKRLALVVHNLDGPCLRAARHQEVLARLARLEAVWLVASVDHVNSPSLWDQSMLSQYNFSYWDATTLLPYTDETSYEGSLLVRRSGALMLSSLANVFRSLTTNAQGIFLVVARYQLERTAGGRQYAGMPFRDLYRRCREELLVSSDQILRAQLTEFLDHKLVVSKRGQGGSEMLTIPLEDSLLETFLEQRSAQDQM